MKSRLPTYLCYALNALFAMIITCYSPLLTFISKTFSIDIAQAGIIFTANFVGFVIFVLIGGILADRVGVKKIMLISLVGFSIALLLFPLSPNFYTACIIMMFIGGFGGTMESNLITVVSILNPAKTSFYINMLQVFFGVGAIIGPLLAGITITQGFNWQLFFFFSSTISIVFTVMFFFIKLVTQQKTEGFSLRVFNALITDKKYLLICLCMALYTGSEIGSWGWLSTSLKENLAFSITKSSLGVGLFWISMTISRLLCGSLSLKFKLRNIIIVLSGISAVFVVISGFLTNEATIWIIIIALGASFSSQWPMIASYGSEHTKSTSGTVIALLVASGGIGATIVPYFMGILADKTNMHIAMASPAVLLSLIAIIFIFFGEKKKETIVNF